MTRFDTEVASKLVAPWDRSRMEANLARIQQRIRGREARKPYTVALAALAMSGVVLAVFLFGLPHVQTTRFATTASSTPATVTRFADGSTATALTGDAVLELQRTAETEVVVAAMAGSYRFDVVPNPARRFTVQISDVTVRVLGTRFVVARANERVEVRVERGRVEVSWGSGRTELGVGDAAWFPPQPEPDGTAASASSTATAAASEVTEGAKAPAKTSVAHERMRFVELSRQGNYQAAFAIVEGAPQLFEGTAEDLMMAADAARLSNHPAHAVPYLERITKAHPRDSRAPLAAFTLGRIYMSQLGQPAAAARAFALVRQLAPSGALVEDAMARETEALERSGQHAAARRLAEEYVRQYPTGRRSNELRQLGKPSKSE